MVTKKVVSLFVFRALIFVGLMLTNVNSYAGGEFSGGETREIRKLKKRFKEMGSLEAFNYKEFDKRIPKIRLPGASSSYQANSSLCIDGNTLQTVQPVEDCYEWTVELKEKEFGKSVIIFSNIFRAQKKLESNGKKLTCTAKDYDYIVVPLQRLETECLVWRVNRKGNRSPVEFTGTYAKKDAEAYAEESSSARGTAYCLPEDMGEVTKVISSTYKITFYKKAKRKNKFNEKLRVGEKIFKFSNCQRFERDPDDLIAPTGGELSGGGGQKQEVKKK